MKAIEQDLLVAVERSLPGAKAAVDYITDHPYPDVFIPEATKIVLGSVFNDLELSLDPSGGSMGSTDAGNIDQPIPVFHPTLLITEGAKVPLHHSDFEQLMKQLGGYKGLKKNAQLLVLLVARLSDPSGGFEQIKRQHQYYRSKIREATLKAETLADKK